MKKFGLKTSKLHRVIAATVCLVMVLGLVFQVTLFSAPEGEKKQVEQAVTRVADASTINSWQEEVGDDTSKVGKVWTDKTVATTVPMLTKGEDASQLTLQDNNFMVGLSALSSNKTTIGEAALPVDAVFVVDISGSMTDRIGSELKIDITIKALNSAIQEILSINEKNRVGVVLYSGNATGNSTEDTATCPMPLGRYYNEENEGTYFSFPDVTDKAQLQLDSGVRSTDVQFDTNWNHIVKGSTYIQNGLMEAVSVFEKAKAISGSNDEKRVPVITLLSDGAPTAVRESYATRGNSTIGEGDKTDLRRTFLTQLTATWIKSKVKDLYPTKEPLFYSVGLLQPSDPDYAYARMVLNPEKDTSTDLNDWWNQFLEADIGVTETYKTISQVVPEEVQIQKEDSSIETRYYVDEYFEATNSNELESAFRDIAEKIRLQSGNYPTDVENENANYSGYLVFEDTIGEYMHIEDMKGVMYEGRLYNGREFATKMCNESLEAPTEDGEAFLDSLMIRLGIENIDDAKELFENARNTGQISSSDSGYSNYIGWYSDKSGGYVGPYVEGKEAPFGAENINRSYFYYGVPENTLEKTNLMYLGVRVTEGIGTLGQIVRFSIPASLIPMTRYYVTKPMKENQNGVTEVTKTSAYPVHLFYEVGLNAGINEYDWSEVRGDYPFKTQEESIRQCDFYANAWKKEAREAQANMIFEPSEKNDFYYYTENTPIYIKSEGAEDGYALYTGEKPSTNQSFYRQKLVYSLEEKVQKVYEKIDESTLSLAQSNGNGWIIPKGTLDKNSATDEILKTESVNEIKYVQKSSVEQNTYRNAGAGSVINVALGNNGAISFRQGKLQVEKQVKNNDYAEGDSDNTPFEFEMTMYSLQNGTEAERIVEQHESSFDTCALENGAHSFQLKNHESKIYWFPLGQRVSVREVGEAIEKYDVSVVVKKGDETIPNDEDREDGEVIISDISSSILFINHCIEISTELKLTKMDRMGETLKGAEFSLYQCQMAEPKSPDKPYPPDKNDSNYEEKYKAYLEKESAYQTEYLEYLNQSKNYEDHIKEEHDHVIEGESGCWKLIGTGTSISGGKVLFNDLEGKPLVLKKGIYRLVETKAPKGYMKPVGQWNIKAVPGGNVAFQFTEVKGNAGERVPAISDVTENSYIVLNYKPIDPPITGGRGIDRFLILGGIVTVSGLMITVHLVLQRKRGKL